jgi:HD-GYP domain-containing protein (c-di-GMP phosphodiesterase class II)
MNSKLKIVVSLMLSQAVCLAAGLWVQQQFLRAVERSPVEAAASWMSSHSTSLVHLLTFVWIGILQAIVAWLVLSRLHGEQEQVANKNQEEALKRAQELVRTRDAIIFGLAKLAESRDPDTGHHLERIALYSTRMAAALKRHSKFRRTVNTSFVRMIGISSALHDIGKVGVEDSILLKPGPLTPDERERVQEHTQFGAECIRQIQRRIGDSSFLEMARQIAMYHHERWDGSGYPDGLQSTQIPLAARIVAIADVYDALSMRRVYKDPYPHDVCVEKIRREAGKHFDPELVEVFLQIEGQFRDIVERFNVPDRLLGAASEPYKESLKQAAELRMTVEQEQMLVETLDAPGLAPVEEPRSPEPAGIRH